MLSRIADDHVKDASGRRQSRLMPRYSLGEGMIESFLNAAQRHFDDAELLRQETRRDGAGHHYGVAGECAVKAVCVEEANTRPSRHFDVSPDKDLRVFAHPHLGGRKGLPIQVVLPSLFVGWSIHDRYAATGHTSALQVEQWRADAQRVLNLMQGL
jgi:hypothetical protein